MPSGHWWCSSFQSTSWEQLTACEDPFILTVTAYPLVFRCALVLSQCIPLFPSFLCFHVSLHSLLSFFSSPLFFALFLPSLSCPNSSPPCYPPLFSSPSIPPSSFSSLCMIIPRNLLPSSLSFPLLLSPLSSQHAVHPEPWFGCRYHNYGSNS